MSVWCQLADVRGILMSACDMLERIASTILLLLHTEYCSGDKIEKNEMGGACSAYGGEERRIQGFGGET